MINREGDCRLAGEEFLVPRSFSDVVLEVQNAWLRSKRPPMREVSQAIDMLPERTKRLWDLVIDNLPDYISDEFSEFTRETHPPPILAHSLFRDRRMARAGCPLEAVPRVSTPQYLDEESARVWERGMSLLNEIAVDGLSLDIIERIGESGSRERKRWYRPFAALLRKVSGELAAYKKGLRQIRKTLGSEEKFEAFRQLLILATMTGKREEIDNYLQTNELGTLDQFAIHLGEKRQYGYKWRILNDIASGASITLQYPGIINIFLKKELLSSVFLLEAEIAYYLAKRVNSLHDAIIAYGLMAMTSLFAVVPNLYLGPRFLIHEFVHYMSYDLEHIGLMPIEWEDANKGKKR